MYTLVEEKVLIKDIAKYVIYKVGNKYTGFVCGYDFDIESISVQTFTGKKGHLLGWNKLGTPLLLTSRKNAIKRMNETYKLIKSGEIQLIVNE